MDHLMSGFLVLLAVDAGISCGPGFLPREPVHVDSSHGPVWASSRHVGGV